MTSNKILQLERGLPPCKCGGRLRISNIRGSSEIVNRKPFLHLTVRCEKCKAWRGGFTCKDKPAWRIAK